MEDSYENGIASVEGERAATEGRAEGSREEGRTPKARPKRKAPSSGPKMSIADLEAIFSSAVEMDEGDAAKVMEHLDGSDVAYLMSDRRIVAVMMPPATYDRMRRG